MREGVRWAALGTRLWWAARWRCPVGGPLLGGAAAALFPTARRPAAEAGAVFIPAVRVAGVRVRDWRGRGREGPGGRDVVLLLLAQVALGGQGEGLVLLGEVGAGGKRG